MFNGGALIVMQSVHKANKSFFVLFTVASTLIFIDVIERGEFASKYVILVRWLISFLETVFEDLGQT